MKIKSVFGFMLIISILTSCEDSRSKNILKKESIDYSDKTVLDSLIKITSHSTDTLFLGFTIGMTKTEYKNHIKKLRSDGKTISFSTSNQITNMAGTFELGTGYTFKTSISNERDGKTLTGNGQYFLEPIYNKGGNLMQLNILPIEKWNGDYGFNKPKWLESRVRENSERFIDKDLKQALMDNEFIDSNDFIRQKANLVIYETTLTINYIDLKTLLLELLIKETEKELIKEENQDIKF